MVTMDRYTYCPLAQGPNRIRLLRILPGADDNEIKCEIFHYTLRVERAYGFYEALSYVWGQESSNPSRISLKNTDDKQYRYLDVRPNLLAALRRLRDPDLPRVLWIDAVCINQDDLQERASQVQFMSRIFSHAASVHVWLGEEADKSCDVFDLLHDAVEDKKRHTNTELSSLSKRIKSKRWLIDSFISRAWFTRIWVIQEVAAARIIAVSCGQNEMVGSLFVKSMELLFSAMDTADSTFMGSAPIVLQFMNKDVTLPGRRITLDPQITAAVPSLDILPLSELLQMFHAHAATDRRDKIYALLGLTTDGLDSLRLRADYTKSWSTLFQEVIAYIFGPSVSATTWDSCEQASITGLGCPLGTFMVDHASSTITVRSKDFVGSRGQKHFWKAQFHMPLHHKTIKGGDTLCLLEGALRPTVVRQCGDHFTVIVAALSPPALVTLVREPIHIPGRKGSVEVICMQTLTWDDFMRRTTEFARQLDLVWDWEAEDHQWKKKYIAPMENATNKSNAHASHALRTLNTARTLEATGHQNSSHDLLTVRASTSLSLPSEPTCTIEEEHLKMYRYVRSHLYEYTELKSHIAQLRWCGWALSNTDGSDVACDFWSAKRVDDMDLVNIISLLHPTNRKKVGVIGPFRYLEGEIDRTRQLTPLLSVLMQHSTRLANIQSDAAHTTHSAHSQVNSDESQLDFPDAARDLMHILLAQYNGELLQPKRLLDACKSDVSLQEARKLAILMFLELNDPTPLHSDNTTPSITSKTQVPSVFLDVLQLLRMADKDHSMVDFIIQQSPNTCGETIYLILRNRLSWGYPGTGWLSNMRDQSWDKWYRIVKESNLCEVMVAHWDTNAKQAMSVLQFFLEEFAVSIAVNKFRSGELLWTKDTAMPQGGRLRLTRLYLLQAIRYQQAKDESSQDQLDGITEDDHAPIFMDSLQLLRGAGTLPSSNVHTLKLESNTDAGTSRELVPSRPLPPSHQLISSRVTSPQQDISANIESRETRSIDGPIVPPDVPMTTSQVAKPYVFPSWG